jgi:hypothetical protein
VERWDGQVCISTDVLWYELPALSNLPEIEDVEPFLIATIMAGMHESRTIVVNGAVSALLLSNLAEFQDAWHSWLPSRYTHVDINAEHIWDLHPSPKANVAVVAYSGGVDASFSVWRHATCQVGHRTHTLKLCVMVHGLDIPLRDTEAFDGASNLAAKVVQSLGLELMSIRTNFREVIQTHWEDTFGTAIASCLQQFKGFAGTGILASSEPYHSLVLPWGSNPVTDHLLSSHSFTIMHDGAAYSRTKKVAALANWETGSMNLRVCWQPGSRGGNCGCCEKCLRTMLNFLANRLPVPPCFPSSTVSAEAIREVSIPNIAVMAEWRQIYDEATQNKLDAPWVWAVRERLRPAT